MRLPVLTKFDATDIKDLPEAVQKVISDYFTTFLGIYAALDRQLTEDNLDIQYKELNVNSTSFPLTFKYTTNHRPRGATLIQCLRKDGQPVAPPAAIYLDWQLGSGKDFRINSVVGLTVGLEYNIRIRIE